jgi:hypothetical protein
MMLCSFKAKGQVYFYLYLSGIELGYGLDDRGIESRQGLEIFLFMTASKPVLEPIQTLIQCVSAALPLGVKRPGHEAYHSPPTSAEVNNEWSYTPLPYKLSWRGAQLKHRDNFTFTFYIHSR